MVRHLNVRCSHWTAGLLILIAGGGVLWHILACAESPLAYSPDGRSLAFVVMDPYQNDALEVPGTHAWRLMVLTDQKDLRVVETSTKAMLSAPAYSPDGAHYAYLRIPLLDRNAAERARILAKEREEKWDEATAGAEGGARTEDMTVPRSEQIHLSHRALASEAPLAATLVLRDAKTHGEVKSVAVALRGIAYGESELLRSYILLRPQYSPDGRQLYFCAGGAALSMDLERETVTIHAVSAQSLALSPDGQTLAVLQSHGEERSEEDVVLAIIRTDGSRAIYQRWKGTPPSLYGIAWAGNGAIAVMMPGHGDEPAEIRFLQADGSPLRAARITLPAEGNQDEVAQIALAPDGKHMVASFGEHVFFLDSAGKVLGRWTAPSGAGGEKPKETYLIHPAFSPDSKTVAFKRLTEARTGTDAIVFFTPDGKQVALADLPPLPAGTTQPAAQAP